MTQELIDLRNSILEGRYDDALAIVDELEGMSRQAILRNIQSDLKILLNHLIKNQIEQQLQLLITIAFKDGEDTPLYLEKLLKQAIQELEKIAAEESEE